MIRDRITNLYSTAGSSPYFKKRGKVFYRHSDLRTHLSYFNKYRYKDRKNPYENCDIIEFDMKEVSSKDVFQELGLMIL
jgi:hypothetical protein